MIKLIGIDIDGTVMNKKRVKPEVVKTLEQAQKQGIHITIATGRNIKSIYKVAQTLGLENSKIPFIAQNGGQVFRFKVDGSAEFSYNHFFSKDDSDILFRLANKSKVQIFSYTNNENLAYVNKKFTPFVFVMSRNSQRKVLLYDFNNPLKSPVSKLIV